MKNRPYFPLIVFLLLVVFMVYTAVTSWNYKPSNGDNPAMGGRILYFSVVAKGFCSSPPCPPAPSPTPYPAALGFPGARRFRSR